MPQGEETDYNHQTVNKSKASLSNNNSSGYGKSLAQQNVESVSTGAKNTDKLCNSIADKDKSFLNRAGQRSI